MVDYTCQLVCSISLYWGLRDASLSALLVAWSERVDLYFIGNFHFASWHLIYDFCLIIKVNSSFPRRYQYRKMFVKIPMIIFWKIPGAWFLFLKEKRLIKFSSNIRLSPPFKRVCSTSKPELWARTLKDFLLKWFIWTGTCHHPHDDPNTFAVIDL